MYAHPLVTRHTASHVAKDGTLRRVAGLTEALQAARGGGYVWLDFVDPSRADLEALIEPLGVHPLSVADCLDSDQIPKVEDFQRHSFLILNTFAVEGAKIRVDEVDFILGEGFLVSVSGHTGGDPGIRERLEKTIPLNAADVGKGPDFLMHLMLEYVVDGKSEALEAMMGEIDAAEERILRDRPAFDLNTLVRLRRQLLVLRKSLFHEREVLIKICRRDSPFIGEKSVYRYRDVYDHLAKFFAQVEISREMLLSLMETHLSLVNNRMAAVAHRTNVSVRRLTLITTIFMPLSLVAGIGGMSEWSMITGPENWKAAYSALLVCMAVMGAATYAILRWMEARARRSDEG